MEQIKHAVSEVEADIEVKKQMTDTLKDLVYEYLNIEGYTIEAEDGKWFHEGEEVFKVEGGLVVENFHKLELPSRERMFLSGTLRAMQALLSDVMAMEAKKRMLDDTMELTDVTAILNEGTEMFPIEEHL